MKGLYQKYNISKTSGKPLAPSFYAIVLRIDGGQYLNACRAGVVAFADAVREQNPILADDVQAKLEELAMGIIEIDEDGNIRGREKPNIVRDPDGIY